MSTLVPCLQQVDWPDKAVLANTRMLKDGVILIGITARLVTPVFIV
jgi:hypothetical protein